MTHSSLKNAGLAVIALGCSMGIAVAQNMAAPPRPQQEKVLERVLKALAEQHAARAKTAGAAATGSKADINNLSAQIPLGWNFAHATHCGWFGASNGDQWFYIRPLEGGLIFIINNLYISQGLQVPCGEGFWIAWHVVDGTTGAYDQTYSYDFK